MLDMKLEIGSMLRMGMVFRVLFLIIKRSGMYDSSITTKGVATNKRLSIIIFKQPTLLRRGHGLDASE